VEISSVNKDDGSLLVASTDAAGRFAITGLNAGRHKILIRRPGYLQKEALFKELSEDHPATSLSIRMTPAAVLTGTVTDERGHPLEGAWVIPLRMQWRDGRMVRSSSPISHTNDLGQFRASGLDPGRYLLMVHYRRGAIRADAAERAGGYAPVYAPGVIEADRALPVDLPPGQTRQVDIVFRISPVVVVRGKLEGERCEEHTRIGLSPLGEPDSGFLWANYQPARVQFQFQGIPVGDYVLRGDCNGVSASRLEGRTVLHIEPGGNQDVDLVMVPRKLVKGRVVAENDAAYVPRKIMTVQAEPVESSWSVRTADVQADGTFRLYAGPELCQISMKGLSDESGEIITKVEYGGKAWKDRIVDFSQDGAEVKIVVVRNSGSFMGRIVDERERPAPHAVVLLLDADKERALRSGPLKAMEAGDDGSFVIRGVPAGKYSVVALRELTPEEASEPLLVSRLLDRAETITIAEGAQETLTVKAKSLVEIYQ